MLADVRNKRVQFVFDILPIISLKSPGREVREFPGTIDYYVTNFHTSIKPELSKVVRDLIDPTGSEVRMLHRKGIVSINDCQVPIHPRPHHVDAIELSKYAAFAETEIASDITVVVQRVFRRRQLPLVKLQPLLLDTCRVGNRLILVKLDRRVASKVHLQLAGFRSRRPRG